MKYTVTFTQHWSYEVEAKTTEEAENIAYEKFSADMHYPCAYTFYDEVEFDPDMDEAEYMETDREWW